ncbi:hypothetical protein DL98DRAFT_36216 [Cadophora sp. DSE1049]|nr:hypothetical protein DL98DRAFT_36216 [Cadophora sp. DSE1049]
MLVSASICCRRSRSRSASLIMKSSFTPERILKFAARLYGTPLGTDEVPHCIVFALGILWCHRNCYWSCLIVLSSLISCHP